MTDGSPFWLLLYGACLALPALGNAWLVWRRKTRAARAHPSGERYVAGCASTTTQRAPWLMRWVVVDAHPLSPRERAAIDRALKARCRKDGTR